MGSHLAEALLRRGDSVTVIDDLSTGSITNISHLKDNPRFNFVLDTVMNAPVLGELVDSAASAALVSCLTGMVLGVG